MIVQTQYSNYIAMYEDYMRKIKQSYNDYYQELSRVINSYYYEYWIHYI